MAERRLIPASAARAEIMVLNSRFISSAGPAFSVEEAREYLNRIKAEFPTASHHVPAYLIGYGSTVIAHCTDAGEPSGTAGRPVLAVLQGSGLGDAAIVVTRYFGGTKLGTGGLVRAYTEAAKAVLNVLPRAEKVATHTVMVAMPYSYYEQARLLAGKHCGQILDQEFSADVTLTVRFAVERLQAFQEALQDLTRGSVQGVVIESDPNTILPLGSWEAGEGNT